MRISAIHLALLVTTVLAGCGDDGAAPMDAATDTALADVAVSDTRTADTEPPPDAAIPGTIGPAERPAMVVSPASAGGPAPVALLLHGYGPGDESFMFLLTLADRLAAAGYFAVVPLGTRDSRGYRFWNANAICCDVDGIGVDDVAYLSGLIADATERLPVDPTRVFIFGHSNGGFMAYRMACDAPDSLRAIVSLAGTEDPTAPCTPSAPTSVLHIHGDADAVAPYAGGPNALNGAPVAGAETTAHRWATISGCDPDAPTTGPSYDHESDMPGAETTSTRWQTGCTPGHAAELWRIRGGPHVPRFTDAFFVDLAAWLDAAGS